MQHKSRTSFVRDRFAFLLFTTQHLLWLMTKRYPLRTDDWEDSFSGFCSWETVQFRTFTAFSGVLLYSNSGSASYSLAGWMGLGRQDQSLFYSIMAGAGSSYLGRKVFSVSFFLTFKIPGGKNDLKHQTWEKFYTKAVVFMVLFGPWVMDWLHWALYYVK